MPDNIVQVIMASAPVDPQERLRLWFSATVRRPPRGAPPEIGWRKKGDGGGKDTCMYCWLAGQLDYPQLTAGEPCLLLQEIHPAPVPEKTILLTWHRAY